MAPVNNRLGAKAVDDRDAQTIPEFCRSHRISKATLNNLKKIGKAPDLIKLGAKNIVTKEASARWRAEREAEPLKTTQPAAAEVDKTAKRSARALQTA